MTNQPSVKKYLQAEALSLVRSGDIETGIEKYRQYLELNPQDDNAWAGLGGAYRRMEMIEQALKSYERAYEINPQSTYALINLVTLRAARNSEEDHKTLEKYIPVAIEMCEKKIESNKADYWTWYDLATVQLIQKNPSALTTFHYAAELTPKTAKENFQSVLNNLNFLRKHNPAIPEISNVIDMISKHLS